MSTVEFRADKEWTRDEVIALSLGRPVVDLSGLRPEQVGWDELPENVVVLDRLDNGDWVLLT